MSTINAPLLGCYLSFSAMTPFVLNSFMDIPNPKLYASIAFFSVGGIYLFDVIHDGDVALNAYIVMGSTFAIWIGGYHYNLLGSTNLILGLANSVSLLLASVFATYVIGG